MPLAEVVFEVAAPGALGRFTREHPDARAVLRLVSLAEPARALLTLAGPTEVTSAVVRELRGEAGDAPFEVLSITPYSVVLKVEPRSAPWLAPVLRFVEVFGGDTLLEPVVVEEGRLRVRGIPARQMDVRSALEKLQELQRSGAWEGFRVVHVGEFDPKAFGARPEPLLDAEQEDLVRLALVMGYYDTPRRCNLEDIAARVGLSVSPVHKKLKEAEHALIHGHLEPNAPRPPRRRRAARARPAAPPGQMREAVVRITGDGSLAAAFTQRHRAARVVYQALAEGPGATSHLYVVFAKPDSARDFLRMLEEDASVTESEVLSRDTEHMSLRVRRRPDDGAKPPADPLDSLRAALGRDAYARPTVVEDGQVLGRVVVLRRLGEEELAATLQELAQERGWQGAELVALRDVTLESALLARPKGERMTERQTEVLRIAHALGYYTTPRGCTLEDIAATLGVSANAVHKNLTAAEQRIVEGYVAVAM